MGGTIARLYPRPDVFGSGQRLRMFRPRPYSRLAGIFPSTPPSWKQPAVFAAVQELVDSGSLMRLIRLLLLSSDCEKSPCRSSAVGTRNRAGSPPPVVRGEY